MPRSRSEHVVTNPLLLRTRLKNWITKLERQLETLRAAYADAFETPPEVKEAERQAKADKRHADWEKRRVWETWFKAEQRLLAMEHCPEGFEFVAVEDDDTPETGLIRARSAHGDKFEYVAVAGSYLGRYPNDPAEFDGDGEVGGWSYGDCWQWYWRMAPFLPPTVHAHAQPLHFREQGYMLFRRPRQHDPAYRKCPSCEGTGYMKTGRAWKKGTRVTEADVTEANGAAHE